MKVVLFANNRVGWQVAKELRAAGAEIVALVVHPLERRKFGDEIVAAAGVPGDRVLDGSRLAEPGVHAALAALRPDIGVSALFGYLLRRPTLELFSRGCINLHPSYLPWNRGAHPNVWCIIEGTPAGTTLHYVDEGVDTGDIIAQRLVEVEPTDTGESLYGRLADASVALFRDTWPAIVSGTSTRTPQPGNAGTTHRARDLARLDQVDLEQNYRAGALIDLLRARTFPPYEGARFTVDGRTVQIRVSLEELGRESQE